VRRLSIRRRPATGPDLPPPRGAWPIDSQNRLYVIDAYGNSNVISPDGGNGAVRRLPAGGGGGEGSPSIRRTGSTWQVWSPWFASRPDGNTARPSSTRRRSRVCLRPVFGPEGLSAPRGGSIRQTCTSPEATWARRPDYIFRVNDDGPRSASFTGAPANPLHLLNALSARGRWPTANIWTASGQVKRGECRRAGFSLGPPGTRDIPATQGPAQQARRFNTGRAGPSRPKWRTCTFSTTNPRALADRPRAGQGRRRDRAGAGNREMP